MTVLSDIPFGKRPPEREAARYGHDSAMAWKFTALLSLLPMWWWLVTVLPPPFSVIDFAEHMIVYGEHYDPYGYHIPPAVEKPQEAEPTLSAPPLPAPDAPVVPLPPVSRGAPESTAAQKEVPVLETQPVLVTARRD